VDWEVSIGMMNSVTARDVPDIRFRLAGYPAIFFESGSGQNGTRYRISQPDSALSFLAVELSSPGVNARVSVFKL